MTADVSYVRPEVTEASEVWQKISDVLAGEDAMKAAGDKYLPRPNAADTSAANATRYEQYVERATFHAGAGRTHTGLVGSAFRKAPVVELPGPLEFMRTDVDGAGLPLIQQAQRCLADVLGLGRRGLLVDFPVTKGDVSRQQIAAGIARPTISLVQPDAIINWRTTVLGARKVLSKLVLAESCVVSDDGYAEETGNQWREYALVDGRVVVTIWRADGDNGAPTIFMQHQPTWANGVPVGEIPFVACGSLNNDIEIDPSPMLDLCNVAIGWWRNSADYEESIHMHGQAMLVLTGLTPDWIKKALGDHIYVGASEALKLPVGGDAKLLQMEANTAVEAAMRAKEAQMLALGAQLVEPGKAARTATEVRIQNAAEMSTLGLCCSNVASAYVQALGWAGLFAGTEEPSTMSIDPDAFLRTLTAEERKQIVADWQAGAISFGEMRTQFRLGGVEIGDDEEAKAEIGSSPVAEGAV